jgi:hypothetical protein
LQFTESARIKDNNKINESTKQAKSEKIGGDDDDNNNNNNNTNNNNNNNNTEKGKLCIFDNNSSSLSAITPPIMRRGKIYIRTYIDSE